MIGLDFGGIQIFVRILDRSSAQVLSGAQLLAAD